MNYGDDGLDPCTTVKVDGEQEICDISRIIAKLNMEHEVKIEEKNKNSPKTKKIQNL